MVSNPSIFYDSIDVCQKDDIFEFQKDSTFDYVDAGTVSPAKWQFFLHLEPGGNQLDHQWQSVGHGKIIVFQKTLPLTTVDNSASPAITETLTFARQ